MVGGRKGNTPVQAFEFNQSPYLKETNNNNISEINYGNSGRGLSNTLPINGNRHQTLT